jgi:fatty acid desaturase
MLRYQADRRTILFLCAFAALSAGGWVLNPSGVAAAGWCIVTCVVSWICAVIAHNTVHCPIFKKRWQNRLMQVWISLSYGFPISEYVPGHNLSHHKFTQKPQDVMRTSKVNTGNNLLNFLLFFFAVGPGVTVGNYRYKQVMKQKLPAWNRQLLVEILSVWGVKGALLLLDWRKALLFYIVPHAFAVWGITTVNYLQHDGCDEDHPYNHSRNFVGRVFNWFTLNNGYHGMHHMRPGLHWSLLAEEHAKVLGPHIDPRLDEPSLAGYMFRAFIWPGKRARYDAQPVVSRRAPDVDWVSATRDVAQAELGAVGSETYAS